MGSPCSSNQNNCTIPLLSLLLVVLMFSCTLAHASSSCVHTEQKQSYNRQRTIVNNSAEFTKDKVVHENTLRKKRLEYLDLKMAKLVDECKDLSSEFHTTAPW